LKDSKFNILAESAKIDQELISSIIAEVNRRPTVIETSAAPALGDGAYTGSYKGKGKDKNKGKGDKNKLKAPPPSAPYAAPAPYAKFTCFTCGLEGHSSRDCPQGAVVVPPKQKAVTERPMKGFGKGGKR
jgi:hypothetical protein